MAYDPDIEPIFAELRASIAGILGLMQTMDARLDALEDGVVVPPSPAVEFRKPADFAASDLRENTNPTGPYTLTDPALIEHHADGTATLRAEQRLGQPVSGKTYYSGSLVTRTPLHFAKGLFGGIVHLKGRTVGALFAYGGSGKEIDFEATHLLGEAGWSPNLWMPKQAGGRYSAGSTSARTLRRAPVTDAPQVLLARLLDDRCEFFYQTLNADLTPAGPLFLFETITPADFPADVTWDVTTKDLAIFTALEFHAAWAGWTAADYAQPASMRVYGITPGAVDATLNAEVVPNDPLVLDAAARTLNGGAWVFGSTNGGRSGFLPDGKTIAMARSTDGTGTATGRVTFPVEPGKRHRLSFSIRGKQISVNGGGASWAGHGSGNYTREWVPTASSELVTFSAGSRTPDYLGAVTMEMIDVVTPPVGTGLENPSIGSNLEGIVDWTTEQPFADVLKTSRSWQGATAAAVRDASDADGHLLRMPAGASGVTTYVLTELPAAMTSAAGRYRLRWTGKGDVRIAGQTITATGPGEAWVNYQPNGGAWTIDLTRIDATDPIRLQSLVHESNVASYDAGEIFSLRYLSRIKDLRVLRFMDWQRTNHSMETSWSGRMTPGRRSWGGWPGEDPSVPLEVMIALANKVGADPWFCIPHRADDDFIRRFAEMVKAELDPRLSAHVENTNEAWNGQFGQATYADDQGIARGYGTNRTVAGARWVANRLSEIGAIWASVFGAAERGKRYRTVLAVHPANTWLANQQLTDGGANSTFGQRFDGYAVTGYFGHSIGSGSAAQDIMNVHAAQGETAAINRAVQLLSASAAGIRGGIDGWDAHKALADRHGLAFMVYEGGAHANPTGSWQSNATFRDVLAKAHRSAGMAPIYRKLLDDWKACGGTVFCVFQWIGRWTQHGYWGHLEHVDASSPRHSEIEAWNASNAAWFDAGRAPGTFLGQA